MLESSGPGRATSRRVLEHHPHAHPPASTPAEHMLAVVASLPMFRLLRLQDLREALPEGVRPLSAALAVHHLEPGPRRRPASCASPPRLAPGGRFVLADVVVPDDPADVVTPLDPGFDLPETVPDLLRWMGDAGLRARVELAGARPGGPGGRRRRRLTAAGQTATT